MYLYRVMVEVTHMKGTQLPLDCGGAFVGVYLRSSNIIDAIRLAEGKLLDDRYQPVRTFEVVELDTEDLSDENEEYTSDGDPETSDLINIFNNGGLWYTAFNTFPNEEKLAH